MVFLLMYLLSFASRLSSCTYALTIMGHVWLGTEPLIMMKCVLEEPEIKPGFLGNYCINMKRFLSIFGLTLPCKMVIVERFQWCWTSIVV